MLVVTQTTINSMTVRSKPSGIRTRTDIFNSFDDLHIKSREFTSISYLFIACTFYDTLECHPALKFLRMISLMFLRILFFTPAEDFLFCYGRLTPNLTRTDVLRRYEMRKPTRVARGINENVLRTF